MKVLFVTGGRDFGETPSERAEIEAWLEKDSPDVVIHGGCKTGADRVAGDWAKRKGVTVGEFAANWTVHNKAAGPLRNQVMAVLAGMAHAGCASEDESVLLLVCPGGTGTADMRDKSHLRGVHVVFLRPAGSGGGGAE